MSDQRSCVHKVPKKWYNNNGFCPFPAKTGSAFCAWHDPGKRRIVLLGRILKANQVIKESQDELSTLPCFRCGARTKDGICQNYGCECPGSH